MDLNTAADTVNKIVTTSAVITGGIWAYLTSQVVFFGNRAQLDISSSLEKRAGSWYLSVFITIKNTGASKLVLNQNRKALRIYEMATQVNGRAGEVQWQGLVTVPILSKHDWLRA